VNNIQKTQIDKGAFIARREMTCNSQHLQLRLDLFFHMIDMYSVIGTLVKSPKSHLELLDSGTVTVSVRYLCKAACIAFYIRFSLSD